MEPQHGITIGKRTIISTDSFVTRDISQRNLCWYPVKSVTISRNAMGSTTFRICVLTKSSGDEKPQQKQY